MIKLAIIGLGEIAKHQIKALEGSDLIRITDVQDIDTSRFNSETLPAGISFHSSLSSLLSKSDADLYMISTPSDTHFEIAKTLIENRRNVVIEKPVCADEQELQILRSLVSRHQVFVYAAFHAAFGAETDWWLKHRDTDETGPLTGFDSGFFDPYIVQGNLLKAGQSLGGSWIDSGINALSVIARFIRPEQLKLRESRLTYFAGNSYQAQGSARLSFNQNGKSGNGIIDTNWTLGVNRKTTRLTYENKEILLHHSLESVFELSDSGAKLLADLRNKSPRLTNHYRALFKDVADAYRNSQSNMELAEKLHQIQFAALRQKDLFPDYVTGSMMSESF